jgi:hypothetical protein
MDFRNAFDPVRALGGAWRLVRRGPATAIVGSLLIFALDGSSPGGVSVEDEHLSWYGAALVGAAVLPCCCLGILLWLLTSYLHLGLATAIQRVMTTGEERFGDLLQARGLFGPMLLARLLKTLSVVVLSLPFLVMVGGPALIGHLLELEGLGIAVGLLFGLLYVPIFVYVLLGLLLVEEVVAFEGKPPFEALRASWSLASGNRIQLLLYSLVLLGVTLAGLLYCFLGILVTGPWCRLAWFESYARYALPVPEGGFAIDQAPK